MANEQKKEEKKRQSIKALIDGKMDEYGMTKKTIYSVVGILGCLLLTIVMSCTGVGFNPAVIATWNYWVGMIIQFGISIYSMITGSQIGDDMQRNAPNGQFRRELSNYKKNYDRIDFLKIFEFFDKWLSLFREKKLHKKVIETIRDFGIKQPEVLDLDFDELDNLRHPYRKNWAGTPYEEKYYNPKKGKSETSFKSLTETQLDAVKAIMNGAVKVSYVSPSYFLNALKGTSTDEWERASQADKKKGQKLASGYTYRVGMMLVLSLASNGLTTVPYEEAGAVALNIATRIFILISSTIWGIYLGFKMVDMDIIFLGYKAEILKLYADEYERGTFKPESIEEEAEREVMEYEEEQKKAMESVVEPEVENALPSNPIMAIEPDHDL